VPLKKNGVLVDGAGQAIFGVVPEPIKVANSNSAGDLAAASAAFQLAIGTIGQVNRAIIEDNLGRALSADELSAFLAADCRVILLL
jgi:sugar/nucleoside kinase (ribokinase family)